MYGALGGRSGLLGGPVAHGSKASEPSPYEFAALCGAPAAIALLQYSLFANVYQRSPHFVLCVVLAGAAFLTIMAYDSRGSHFRLFLSLFCLFGVVSSALVGMVASDVAFSHFWFLHESSAYANVLPSELAGGYADAGKIIFTDGSILDTSKALGYKDVSVYCVAPVTDADVPTPVVQFWAVGMDCCGARGTFLCDDAWDSKARSAVVVQDFHGYYAAAVRQAQAAFGLAAAPSPVLVRWVRDPWRVETNYWRVGVALLLAGFFVQMLLLGVGALSIGAVFSHGFVEIFRK